MKADDRTTTVSRRNAIKTLALGVSGVMTAPGLSEAAWAQAVAVRKQAADAPAGGLTFFTAAQHHTVDVLSELIIPSDERTPGASAAKVADFIDLLLSGALDEDQAVWRRGLAKLDETTMDRWTHPFVDCTPDQQVTLLTEISGHEDKPRTALEKLFGEVKERTIQGYYTSEIGIHQELGYKGNQFLDEFVGCTHPEHGA
jgi:gluconate 2-dehydrogenase subunit 3-like protein